MRVFTERKTAFVMQNFGVWGWRELVTILDETRKGTSLADSSRFLNFGNVC